MEDEKMMILHMLEQDKISIDEASMLIEALDKAESTELEENGFFSKIKEEDNPSVKVDITKKKDVKSQTWERDLENRMKKLGKKIESKFDKDFTDKVEKKGQEFGEKMSELGENIAEGTSSLTDRILDMVENAVDKGSFINIFGSHETIAEKHEKDISNISSPELVFQGVNGKILLKTWKEDKIHVDAFCQVKKKDLNQGTPIYSIYEEDNKIIFKPSYTHNLGAKLEIKIPEKEYAKIHLITTNGRIQASDIDLDQFICNTTNSTVSLANIKSSEINIDTKNGKIILENIKSTNLVLGTSNGVIELQDINCSDIKATTKNSKIIFDDVVTDAVLAKTSNGHINMNNCDTKIFDTETSNGKINFYDLNTERLSALYMKTSNSSIEANFKNLNKMFRIDAKTSMGQIDVVLPNLVYDENYQKHLGTKKILAHSAEYNEKSGVKVIALTSNGSIQIR